MSKLHICKFYTGRAHLIASLLIALKEAMDSNMMFVYCTDEDYGDKLYSYFIQLSKANELENMAAATIDGLNTIYECALGQTSRDKFDSSILRESLGESVFVNFYNQQCKINDDLKRLYLLAKERGFGGVYLCVQMDSIYYMLGEKKLEALEEIIDNAAEEQNVRVNCFYDVFKSYQSNLITKIMDSHEYAMHCSKVYRTDELFA
jgi:hypothetical protein